MKKMLLSICILLVLGALAVAEEMKPAQPASDAAQSPPKHYVVHLKNGGTIETNNYTIEKDRIKVELSTGRIYLDKALVKDVEEVKGIEETPVQKIPVAPHEAAPPVKPSGKNKPAGPPAIPEEAYAPTDDNGHDELWWRDRAGDWRKRRDEAMVRYKKAEVQWNEYNGILQNVDPKTVSQFEITKYQDLMGAGRVGMDNAQAEIDEADRMLNDVLPEEARRAGAPPGWLR